MKYIKTYKENILESSHIEAHKILHKEYSDVSQYIKDILLELEDDGLKTNAEVSEQLSNFHGFTYIDVDIKGNLNNIKRYVDTILSINDYCESVGFYIKMVCVHSAIIGPGSNNREVYSNIDVFERDVRKGVFSRVYDITLMITKK